MRNSFLDKADIKKKILGHCDACAYAFQLPVTGLSGMIHQTSTVAMAQRGIFRRNIHRLSVDLKRR
jgi:hypothetical protein